MDPTANTQPTTSFPIGDSAPPPPETDTSFSNMAANSNITTATDSPPTDTPAVVTTPGGTGGGSRRRVIMIGIALVLMLVGLASGTYLLTRQQLEPSFAWDCATYKFEVDSTGAVIVLNGSIRDLPAQVASVYLDGELVAEFDVPALDSGDSASLGVVPVPDNGRFEWRIIGNKDCDQSGTFKPESLAQCLSVKVFDEDWEPITAAELTSYSPGDVVRFTIGGITNTGSFSAARFTINSEETEAVTEKRPGTDEFFIEYEIPEDVETFSVNAELMHSEIGWVGK